MPRHSVAQAGRVSVRVSVRGSVRVSVRVGVVRDLAWTPSGSSSALRFTLSRSRVEYIERRLLNLSAPQVDSLPSRSERRTRFDGHVRRSPVSRRLLSAAEPQPAASASPAHAADASFGLADLHADCASWADKGECTHNSAFMVFKCQSSCALKADADACKAWAAEGRCKDALNFMHAACAGVCEPPTAVAPAPS
eukprot:3664463-Pleurochrysis_carterae.AAC.2